MPNYLTQTIMRRMRFAVPAVCLAVMASGCDTDEILSVDPSVLVPANQAITDPVSAKAAAAGLYDALQGGSYYGETFYTFGDLLSDNALHTGTFSAYATADNLQMNPENTSISAIWAAIYDGVARANVLINALGTPSFTISDAVRNQYLGEAYLARALGHHNATKHWGKVPLILAPVNTPAEAAAVTRSEVAAVYTQILKDLDSAQFYLPTSVGSYRAGNYLAARGLRARVLLYQASTLTGTAQTAALNAVITEANYVMTRRALADAYGELFDEVGSLTDEDLLRVAFTDQDVGSVSYYYMDRGLGGRRELGPTNDAVATAAAAPAEARDSAFIGIRRIYESGDARNAVTIGQATATRFYVRKYPSVTGTEHIHVIRLAEVILAKAEAHARLGQLAEATTALNMVRVRAGVPAKVLGVTPRYTTDADVLRAIIRERRVELAFEGDRYADLIRTGLITPFVAWRGANSSQALYPVPQTERDVAQGLDQNPGY